MSKRQPTSVGLANWPEIDRRLWSTAITSGEFLEPHGAAAHWSEATKLQVQKGYGKWIFHLVEEGSLSARSDSLPVERIDEDQLRSYLARLEDQGLATQTIASRITDLTEAIRVMHPGADISILKKLASTMQQRAIPSRKKHVRIKPPREIWQACLAFMVKSIRDNPNPNMYQASRYRDAMSLGLLAHRPLRRRNISNLELNAHLIIENGAWHCFIPGDETKDSLPINFILPESEDFCMVFDYYLRTVRQALLRKSMLASNEVKNLQGALWISMRGGAMSGHAFYYSINRISEELLGAPINPHLLRDCAVSALSSDAPEYILAGSRILRHSSLNTTLSHYEQSSMLAAGFYLASAIETIQERALESSPPQPSDLPFMDFEDFIS